MRSLILAAGYATRLYPLTKDYPKPLLDVGEKKILEWLLEDIDEIDAVEEHIVVTNHRFAQIFLDWARGYGSRLSKPLRILDDGTVDNEHRLGAVRDIYLAVQERHDSDYLVLAGDNVLDFSLRGFVDFFEGKKASAVMCYEENRLEKQQKTGIILLDAEGRVTDMQEKPKEPMSNLAVPPFYCYRAKDLARIPEALKEGCSADAPGSLAGWLSRKTCVYAYPMPGRRFDIGSPESYRAVQERYGGRVK